VRIPRLIPNPQRAIKALAWQTAGLVVLAATTKYVPNVWVRWGIYTVSAAYGIWYPMTRALLTLTKLDQQIENI